MLFNEALLTMMGCSKSRVLHINYNLNTYLMADILTDCELPYFVGYMGVVSALIFSGLGASYAMYKAGSAIVALGIVKPELIIKSSIPIVMAQVLGIYGIIMAIIIGQRSNSIFMQFRQVITLIGSPTPILPQDYAVDSVA